MGVGGGGGGILKTEEKVSKLFHVYTIIMVSISTDARDGTSEISPDPTTKSHTVAENDSLGLQNTLEAQTFTHDGVGVLLSWSCCPDTAPWEFRRPTYRCYS